MRDPVRKILWPILLALAASTAAHAQGGPPFLTDDPETPGNRHFEINFGFIGDRNPAAGAYQVPDFDVNYGLGDRIQLKYEVPIAIAESRPLPATPAAPAQQGFVLGGLGNSLLGIKWRFYERHAGDSLITGRFGTGLLSAFRRQPAPAGASGDSPGAKDAPEQHVSFSVSTYPQLSLENPTRSAARGLVDPGPDFFLPLEFNGRLGPLRYDAEFGYHFGNTALAQRWIRGLILGHEFSDRTEAYAELYDQQDANRVDFQPKQRETTLGLGGRQALNAHKTLNLLLMGGRSFQAITAANSQPSWIAYVGLQLLLGPREPASSQPEPRVTLPPPAKR